MAGVIKGVLDQVRDALDINSATLSGAIDVVVVRQPDGSLASTPFHVRFGKLQLLRSREKRVTVKINGVIAPFQMKLGSTGEAFFVEEIDHEPPPNLLTSPFASPLSSPDPVTCSSSLDGIMDAERSLLPLDGMQSGRIVERRLVADDDFGVISADAVRSDGDYPSDVANSLQWEWGELPQQHKKGPLAVRGHRSGSLLGRSRVNDARQFKSDDETWNAGEVPGIMKADNLQRHFLLDHFEEADDSEIADNVDMHRKASWSIFSPWSGVRASSGTVASQHSHVRQRRHTPQLPLEEADAQRGDFGEAGRPEGRAQRKEWVSEDNTGEQIGRPLELSNSFATSKEDDEAFERSVEVRSSTNTRATSKKANVEAIIDVVEAQSDSETACVLGDSSKNPERMVRSGVSPSDVIGDNTKETAEDVDVAICKASIDNGDVTGTGSGPPHSRDACSDRNRMVAEVNATRRTAVRTKDESQDKAIAQVHGEKSQVHSRRSSGAGTVIPGGAEPMPRPFGLSQSSRKKRSSKSSAAEKQYRRALQPLSVNDSPPELSLCGSDLTEAMMTLQGEECHAVFDAKKLSFPDFVAGVPEIMFDHRLCVRHNDRVLTWKAACPMLVANMVYGRLLPPDIADKCVNAGSSSKSTGWGWFWGGSQQQRPRGETHASDEFFDDDGYAGDSQGDNDKDAGRFSANVDAVAHDTGNVESGVATDATANRICVSREDSTVGQGADHSLRVGECEEDDVGDPTTTGSTAPINLGENRMPTTSDHEAGPHTSEYVDNGGALDDFDDFDVDDIDDDGTFQIFMQKSVRPTSKMLTELQLRPGANTVSFEVTSTLQGKQMVSSRIFLWDHNDQIVISDVDGTITRSDVLGHVLPALGRDWSHSGVASLFTKVRQNGFHIVYLTSRSIGQAQTTRSYLQSVQQGETSLPDGPTLMSPDSLLFAFTREVILRRPEEFKIACLLDLRGLFPRDAEPFYAGFGNRHTDVISYMRAGVPQARVFIINPQGQLHHTNKTYIKSYEKLDELADVMFPPHDCRRVETESYNDYNYWREPMASLILSDDSAAEDAETPTPSQVTASSDAGLHSAIEGGLVGSVDEPYPKNDGETRRARNVGSCFDDNHGAANIAAGAASSVDGIV